jgi:RimJ/RimL family protein N-acetyltransferase
VFVATIPAADGIDIVGAGQYVRAGEGNDKTCEFAITVAEDWRRLGLATRLLASLVRRARRDGYETIEGWVIAQNTPILAVARKIHFKVDPVSGMPRCCAYGAHCSVYDSNSTVPHAVCCLPPRKAAGCRARVA